MPAIVFLFCSREAVKRCFHTQALTIIDQVKFDVDEHDNWIGTWTTTNDKEMKEMLEQEQAATDIDLGEFNPSRDTSEDRLSTLDLDGQSMETRQDGASVFNSHLGIGRPPHAEENPNPPDTAAVNGEDPAPGDATQQPDAAVPVEGSVLLCQSTLDTQPLSPESQCDPTW